MGDKAQAAAAAAAAERERERETEATGQSGVTQYVYMHTNVPLLFRIWQYSYSDAGRVNSKVWSDFPNEAFLKI